MKTVMQIEIETPNSEKVNVVPEEGKSEEDYTKQELVKFRKGYADDLHEAVINRLQNYVSDRFEDDFVEDADNVSIEGYESFNDYGVKVVVLDTGTN